MFDFDELELKSPSAQTQRGLRKVRTTPGSLTALAGDDDSTCITAGFKDAERHLSQEQVTILGEFDYAADDEANRVALQEAEAIASQLSTRELVMVVSGKGLWANHGVPRLGVPGLNMTDGPYGARGPYTDGPCTALTPCGVSLASTWDLHLVARIGMLLAEETKLKGSHILLGPCVNLTRIPTGGRTFECLGEDPCLAAQLAVAYIRGVQAMGVGACVKHFIVNDQEKDRKRLNVVVSDRALRRVHMVPFEAAVKEARVLSVMTAYNKINGRYCSESEWLVTDVLRKDWGFEGLVVSDWTAAHHTQRCINAGLDLDMPGRRAMCYGEKLLSELKQNNVPLEKVKQRAIAVLQVMARLGLKKDTNPIENHLAENPLPSPDTREQRELLHKAASEGMVLLKNQGNLLPLSDRTKLAVIGPHVQELTVQGGGSASVKINNCVTSLVEALKRKHFGELRVCMGCDSRTFLPPLRLPFLRAESGNGVLNGVFYAQPQEQNRRSGLKPAIRATNVKEPVYKMDIPDLGHTTFSGVFLGTPPPGFAVGDDWFAKFNGRLYPEDTGEYEFSTYASGKVKVFVNDKLLMEVPKAGQEPLMLPPDDYHLKVSNEVRESIELDGGRVYRFRVEWQCGIGFYPAQCYLGGRRKTWKDQDTLMARAERSAKECDAALVVVGTDCWFENEGDDQPSFQLPGRSAELIERVARANSRTIVCLNIGSPKSMDRWLDKVAAVLVPWYGGQESAIALADVILGRGLGPCGRLPLTWPKKLADGPTGVIPNERYPGIKSKVQYLEEEFIGYRWYEAKGIIPAFPFGHGLSYTEVQFLDAVLPKGNSFVQGQSVPVQVAVENTGKRAGMEVIQIYVVALHDRPYSVDLDGSTMTLGKELAAFAKIMLDVGEASDVDILIPARVFKDVSAQSLSPQHLSPSPSLTSISSMAMEQMESAKNNPSFVTLPSCSPRRRRFSREGGLLKAVPARTTTLVPVLIRHAVEHEVLHLRVPADATIRDVKETMLRGAGDVDPSEVCLSRRFFSTLTQLDDSSPLGEMRDLVVTGMSFKGYQYGAVASALGCEILEGGEVTTCPNCPAMVIVASASTIAASRMGTFTKTEIATSSQQEGRPIYVNALGQYLYYWSDASDWRIGPSYLQDEPGIKATGGSAAENPLGASNWQVWEQGQWTSADDIVVKEFKPLQELLVRGAEATQAKRMGLFTLTNLPRSEMHAHRPIYVNHQGQYLYYWATYAAWRIGPDYTKESSGVTSSGSQVAGCPTLARGWQIWDGSSWTLQYNISVKDPDDKEEGNMSDVPAYYSCDQGGEPGSPSADSTGSAFTSVSGDESPRSPDGSPSGSPSASPSEKGFSDVSPSPPRRSAGDGQSSLVKSSTSRSSALSPSRREREGRCRASRATRGERVKQRMRIGTTGFSAGGEAQVAGLRGRPVESVPARRPSVSAGLPPDMLGVLECEVGTLPSPSCQADPSSLKEDPQPASGVLSKSLLEKAAQASRPTHRFELHIGKSSADIIFKREIEFVY